MCRFFSEPRFLPISLSRSQSTALSLIRFLFPLTFNCKQQTAAIMLLPYFTVATATTTTIATESQPTWRSSERIELVGNIYVRFRLQLSRETEGLRMREREGGRGRASE